MCIHPRKKSNNLTHKRTFLSTLTVINKKFISSLLKSAYDNLEKVNPSVCYLVMETLWEIKAPPNFLTLSWKIIKGTNYLVSKIVSNLVNIVTNYFLSLNWITI